MNNNDPVKFRITTRGGNVFLCELRNRYAFNRLIEAWEGRNPVKFVSMRSQSIGEHDTRFRVAAIDAIEEWR